MNKKVWSVVAAGSLALSACGSATAPEALAGEDTDTAYESPLGEFLGWTQSVDFDEEAAQAEWAEQERQVQEAIAACMAVEGFEYLPIDMAAQNAYYEAQYAEDLEYGSVEWAGEHGYGVSTQRFTQQQVGPDLVGNTYSVVVDDGPPDPNQDYVQSLGLNEQQAYSIALWGDDQGVEWDETLTEEENQAIVDDYYENVYVPTGCQNTAQEEVYNSGWQSAWDDLEAEFGDLFIEMEERIEAHPDVIAYREGVRTCVEEQGLAFLTDQESYDYFEQALTDAGLGWDSQEDPLAGVDTSAFTDEDYQRAYEAVNTTLLAPDKLEALATVQKDEIASAIVHQECGASWQDVEAARQPVRIEIEREFLLDQAERLAAFEGAFRF